MRFSLIFLGLVFSSYSLVFGAKENLELKEKIIGTWFNEKEKALYCFLPDSTIYTIYGQAKTFRGKWTVLNNTLYIYDYKDIEKNTYDKATAFLMIPIQLLTDKELILFSMIEEKQIQCIRLSY